MADVSCYPVLCSAEEEAGRCLGRGGEAYQVAGLHPPAWFPAAFLLLLDRSAVRKVPGSTTGSSWPPEQSPEGTAPEGAPAPALSYPLIGPQPPVQSGARCLSTPCACQFSAGVRGEKGALLSSVMLRLEGPSAAFAPCMGSSDRLYHGVGMPRSPQQRASRSRRWRRPSSTSHPG